MEAPKSRPSAHTLPENVFGTPLQPDPPPVKAESESLNRYMYQRPPLHTHLVRSLNESVCVVFNLNESIDAVTRNAGN
jgi:hypothetical protein